MTSPFTPEEAELYDWLRGCLPPEMTSRTDVPQEVWRAIVKALGRVRGVVQAYATQTYILYAEDVWLDQHARDRGTFRQFGESDAGLQTRLCNPLDAVNVAALIAAVTTVLDADHLTWTPNLIELRQSGAFLQIGASPSGTGDTLEVSDATVTLTDMGNTFTGYEVGRQITLSGCANAANDGTFTITDVLGDQQIAFTNASGVDETHAFSWMIDAGRNGRRLVYCDRGYRVHGSCIIIILPHACTDAQVASVRETVRQRKAAGVVAVIEREHS